MIESIIEWSIRNRFLVILASLVLGVAGVRAMLTMPVDAIPDLSENQVIVFTDWMGRSPQEIEDQVTYPLSVNLQGLAGVKVVRSSSEFNFSMITIIFNDDTDYYFARQRVLEKLLDRLDVPAAGRDPLPGPRRHGRRPDLLVHRRGRGQGPQRAAVDPGLVRPLPAQQRAGRGRGRLRRRCAEGVPDRPRPQQAPGLRHQPGRGLLGRRPVELVRRRPGHPPGERRVPDPLRRLDREPRRHPRDGRRPARQRHADQRRHAGHGPGRPGLPPQRAGEGRQGGRRRRGADALRREPAGGHAPGQGEDHHAPGRACPRACGSSRSTTARR